MASCEKCWRDANRDPYGNVADEYDRLLHERAARPCTPEQQAGDDATECPRCERRTMHQYAKVCTICGEQARRGKGR